MAAPDLACPVCDADNPMSGDEHPGEEVNCVYCGAPCVIRGRADDPQEWKLVEDD